MGIARKVNKAANAALTVKNTFEVFYLEKTAKNVVDSTLRNYRQSFEYFMDYHGFDDNTTFSEITQSHFFKWANSMKGNGVAITSINHYLRDCRVYFKWCMAYPREYIKPAFAITEIKEQEEQPKVFEEDYIEALLIKPRVQDNFGTWRTWAIVNWILATGNRSSTIVDVKIGDVDFKNKEIILTHTKSKKAQTTVLSSALSTVLKEYIKLWRDGASPDDYLFPNIGDEKLTTNALRHSFAKYCGERGVEQTNIHGLRHSFALQWLKNNGDVFQLQRLLGHSTLEMTKRYVRMNVNDMKTGFDEHSPLDVMKKGVRRTAKVKRSK